MVDRRTVLAGLAATTLPAFAEPADDDARHALDAAERDQPADALARLREIDPRRLSPALRLDLAAARAGLAIDAALADRPEDFALRIHRTLGTGPEPAAAIRRIDRALAALQAEATTLFDRIGLRKGPGTGTIGARYVTLFAADEGRYPDDDSGRTRAVADMRARLARLRPLTRTLIADVPPFCLDVDVRALSPAEVAARRQGYRTPPAPGRPGAYIVDLRDLSRRPAWSLPSVVAHELLPGHMVQSGIEEVAPPHPLRARYAAAFVEGWAIHAETLAPFADPRERLGHLHWLIFRAARARIDLGLHHQRWSLDEARARLIEWQGVAAYFAPFDTDLARIAREPGTRTAEALAWLTLADRAPRGQAARRHWHAAVLAHGRKRLEQLP